MTDDSNMWRSLEKDFRAIEDPLKLLRADRQHQADVPDIWRLTGTPSATVRARFEAVATSAGKALRTDHSILSALPDEVLCQVDPVDRWLTAIRLMTSGYKPSTTTSWEVDKDGNRVGGIHSGGTIYEVIEWSAILCLHLAAQTQPIAIAPEAEKAPATRESTGDVQAESDLAKQIIQLLQEIIIRGAEVIYENQRKWAQKSRMDYPYGGPILSFSKIVDTLTLIPSVEIMGQKTPERWEPPKLGEISECLKQFSHWQGRLGRDSDENLYLIRKHLRPLTIQTLNQVSSSYGFWPRNDPSSGIWVAYISPRTTDLFSDKNKNEDELTLDDELDAPEFKALVDEFNLLLARLERVANRQKVPPVIFPLPLPPHDAGSKEGGGTGPDPSPAAFAEDVAGKSNILSEEQLKPASTAPAQEPESAPSNLTAQWHKLGKLRIRADFLEVQRGKHKWTLTLNQGKALEFVYKSHVANGSIHQRQVLRHIESPSARLREAFRSRKGLYKALFSKGEGGKGHIRLNA